MNLLPDTAIWMSLSDATFEGHLAAVLAFEHKMASKSQLSFSLDKVAALVNYELGSGEPVSKKHPFKSLQSFKKKKQKLEILQLNKEAELEWKRIVALKAQAAQHIKATKIIELDEEMAGVLSDVEISSREEEAGEAWELKKKDTKKKKEEAEKKKKAEAEKKRKEEAEKKKKEAEKKKKEMKEVAKKRKLDEPTIRRRTEGMMKPKPAKGRAKPETPEGSKKQCSRRTPAPSPTKKKETVALGDLKEKKAAAELNKISRTLTGPLWPQFMAQHFPKTPLTFGEWPKVYDDEGKRTNEELDVECSNCDAPGLCKGLFLFKDSNFVIRFCFHVFNMPFQAPRCRDIGSSV